MKQRFSAQELFELRNTIPVDWLIKDCLRIPVKISDGIFRFLCPLCNEFQTATNPSTNLARCFRCDKNFNPIDLVMVVKGIGFVESVNYLKPILSESCADPGKNIYGLQQMLDSIGNPITGPAR